MNERRVEELIAERARALETLGWVPAETAERWRRELAREAEAELAAGRAAPRGRRAWLVLGSLAAAATIAAVSFAPRWPTAPLDARFGLLDVAGRELGTVTRSAGEPGREPALPALIVRDGEALLEVAAQEPLWVWFAAWDARGVRIHTIPRATQVSPSDGAALLQLSLADLGERSATTGWLVVVASRARLPDRSLSEAFERTGPGDDGVDPGALLGRAAARLERRHAARTWVRELRVE